MLFMKMKLEDIIYLKSRAINLVLHSERVRPILLSGDRLNFWLFGEQNRVVSLVFINYLVRKNPSSKGMYVAS